VRVALLFAALLLLGACTFERRADVGSERALPGEGVELPEGSTTPAEDSIRAIVAAVGEALRVGDASRVALLTAPGATLVDAEAGTFWTRDDLMGTLPRQLEDRETPQTWSLERSRITRFGDAALLVDEYHVAEASVQPESRAIETLLLVRSDGGWRLAHLHRALLSPPPEATP
jgi:ketosteroid isomerase-like protein